MAQFLYKEVNEDGGGDYTTLAACIDGNEQDLTGDGWFDIEITGEWDNPDTSAVVTDGYTLTTNDYINIYTSGDARHDGREAAVSGGKNYRLVVGGDYIEPLSLRNGYTTIDGLEIRSTGFNGHGIQVLGVGTGTVIKECIVRDCRNTGIYAYGSSGDTAEVTVMNCIIYSCTGAGIYHNGYSSENCWLYNNTCYGNGGAGIILNLSEDHAGQVLKNNLCVGNNPDYSDLSTCTSLTNASGDETGTDGYRGSDGWDSAEFVSIAGGSEDFHLAFGANSIGVATKLSGDFTIDVDSQTRISWDIGADEYFGILIYSKGNYDILPVGKDDLESGFTEAEYATVLTSDDSRVPQLAVGEFAVFMFKDSNSLIINFSVSWEGQSIIAPSSSRVYLQIFNVAANCWKTIDSNNSAAVNTDFTLSSLQPESGDSVNDYFESGNTVTCRVYQEAS